MTRREALFAACRESRSDDDARLALADHLDASGGEADAARAALIRDLCRAEALRRGGPDWRADWEALEPRSRELMATVATARGWGEAVLLWDRGLVVGVAACWERWAEIADDLLGENDVQGVVLLNWPSLRGRSTSDEPGWAYRLSPRSRPKVLAVPDPPDPQITVEAVTRKLLQAEWPTVSEWKLPSIGVAANAA